MKLRKSFNRKALKECAKNTKKNQEVTQSCTENAQSFTEKKILQVFTEFTPFRGQGAWGGRVVFIGPK
jgi:hypothetical protein